MKQNTFLRGWVLILLVFSLFVNAMANYLPIGGKTTGEISNQFDIFFVPAAYVFSIWGLIYVALTAFAIYQTFSLHAHKSRLENMQMIRMWFILGAVANSTWIFLWHLGYPVASVVPMIVLLVSLVMAYAEIERRVKKFTRADWWLVHAPFSLYLGWISVATIANISVALYVLGWSHCGVGPETWAAMMMVVAAIVAGVMAYKHHDAIFVAVVMWAIIGIRAKFPGVYIISSTAELTVIALMAFLLVALVGWQHKMSVGAPAKSIRKPRKRRKK